MNQILKIILFIIGSIPLLGYGQTEVKRESFTTAANVTTSKAGGLCGGDNSGACGTANTLNVDACTSWSGFGGSGDQPFLFAQDYDDCGGTGVGLVENTVVDLGTLAAGNTGEITFKGLFGSRGSGSAVAYDANDSAIVEISTNGGGSYTKYLKLDRFSGDQLQVSNYDGSNTETLSLTYTERSISLGTGLNGQQILVRTTYYNLTGSEAVASDEFTLWHCATGDSEGVVEDNFDEPDNIAYATYNVASGLTTGNSLKIGEFIIKDGGGDGDADTEATTLTDITFSVSNFNYFKAIALFDGAVNIGEEITVAANISFNGLSLVAADEGTKTFDVYATFNNNVVDNEQVQLTIQSVTEDCGSKFAAADGGGASTSITGDDNRIEVTATKLLVTGDDWSDIDTDFTLTVTAVDANNLTDKDETPSVTLSEDGAGTMSSITGLTQNLVAGTYTWTDVQHDTEETITVTASDGVLTDGTKSVVLNGPTTYYVNDGTMDGDELWCTAIGSDANPGTAASPWLTLNKVLTTAAAGDIIYFDVGTYNSANDKDQTISLAKLRITGAGMEKTIFDNPGADNYFVTITANDVVLSDFTIFSFNENGTAKGKALDINGATGVVVNNIQFDKNNETGGGYAIEIYNNASVIFNGGGTTCNNFSGSGGARVLGATSDVTFNQFQFILNERSEKGAGLKIEAGTVTLNSSRFANNEGSSDQKGVGLFINGGTTTINDCIFEDNDYVVATNFIGGAISIAAGTVDINRSEIKNTTSSSGSGVYGAGIGVTGGTVTIDSCIFSGNSGERANDIYVDGGSVTAYNSTFSSSANQIGRVSGTFTISDCGSPTEYGSGITKTNTDAPSFTSGITLPDNYSGNCATAVVLPIELNYIRGKCTEKGVFISWETSSEINNRYFILEKSQDKETFEEINSINGAGNSNNLIHYQTIDEIGELGIYYYRIKQVDFNGDYSYSKTIAIDNSCAIDNLINYVTMNEDELLINYWTERNAPVQINLYDLSGKLIYNTSKILLEGNSTDSILLNKNLASGLFIISITSKKHIFTQKISNF